MLKQLAAAIDTYEKVKNTRWAMPPSSEAHLLWRVERRLADMILELSADVAKPWRLQCIQSS
jgi:hypothetical protein